VEFLPENQETMALIARLSGTKVSDPNVAQTLNVWYIFTLIWMVFMVNVGKYTVHGCCLGFYMGGTFFPKRTKVQFVGEMKNIIPFTLIH